MSISEKHKEFVSESIVDKSVRELPGIGEELGQRLEEKGFKTAEKVVGQYLILRKKEDLFKDWLKQACRANEQQQNDCYDCIKEWCDFNL
ncbi:hypothetical protein AGOR_G00035140 [Albula goreensis]|uniref:Barrier-to-autointegration factor-like protein n=2 Tax=Albula TaxID=54908 RepID=A0A8T3E1K8_9TELE|nr:hypothetical protein JZ751_000156 [Albula glossodonta]KAI1901507.1 hypothetical protein AGOR_G00035140 [Albula goreensis]